MIKKLPFCIIFLFTFFTNAQIGLTETFDAGVPDDWTTDGANFLGTGNQTCDDGQSVRANIYSFNDASTLSSPNFVGASNATDLALSLEYKLVDWSAATEATEPGWGSFNIEYSTDGGANWVLVETIDDSNHITSNECETLSYTIDAADLPDGSDFQFRIDITWADGDYYFYLDNIIAVQTTSEVPNCDSVLATPADGATDVDIETDLAWTASSGLPNEYFLTVGTTPGGNELIDNVSTGTATNYTFSEFLDYETTYYVSIVPSNDNGLADTNTCAEFTFTTEDDPSQVVDCDSGPLSEEYCYGNNEDTTFVYTSSDGSLLNLNITSGFLESCCDDLTVIDSDGTVLFTGGGEVSGQSFQSSGDTISVLIESDGSINCEGNGYDIIQYNVACATCVNPQASFELVNDCLNAPQFFIDVDVTDLGTASSVEITDSEGVSSETVTETGVVQVGPYPNGTDVTVSIENLDDANCSITSSTFTQEFCTLTEVACDTPLDETFCYGNNEDVTIEYVSEDGTPLNLTFDAGAIEVGFDDIIVFDTDGSILFDGDGDLTGLTFQSTGDTISFQIISDGSISCESGSRPEIEYSVVCATCINPAASFELVSDCLNAPQYFVDVDITDLGSATSLEVSDSEGISTETVTETGVVQLGPFPNGTNVTVDVQSLDDANCSLTSSEFSQEFCTLNEVTCDSPFFDSYCYPNNDDTTIEFVSEDGSLLNLNFTAGNVDGFDGIVIFDTDGSVLFDGDGDLTNLSFQSSGDSISFQITSSGFNSCETGQQPEIEYNVTCATCTNPEVSFQVIDDCPSGEDQFFVEVDVADLGTAESLDLTDDQGNEILAVDELGIQQFGPYPNGTSVEITVENTDDANCIIISNTLSQTACPPDNNSCDSATIAEVNDGNLCEVLNPGTLLQAGATSVPSSCHPNISQDVWFEFEATAEVHTVTVIPEIIPDFGGAFFGIAVYTDDCGDLTELYCSTEFNDFGNSDAIAAENLTPGENYYVRVYNFGDTDADDANFDLCITTPQFFEDNELCNSIQPFCAPVDDEGNPTPLVFPNGYFYLEESVAEEGPDYGCLGSEPNPAWFYLTVEQSGDLQFEIIQSTAFDENGQVLGDLLDVDFIAYGPFTGAEDNCGDLTSANTVDCSFSASSIELMDIPGAVEGEVYAVLITNYDQSPGYISLSQINIGQPGGGSTNCDDVFGVEFGCASEGVILSSEIVDGNAYQWFILDDPEADPTDTSNYVPVENGEDQEYLATQSGSYFVLSQAQDNTFEEEFFTVRLSETPVLDIELEHNLCEGETLTLDATPTNSDNYSNITYQWFDENGPIDGATSPQFTFDETGLHTLEITTEELLASTTFECINEFEINIQGAAFDINLGEDQFFCDTDEEQTITAAIEGDLPDEASISYLWNTGEETASIQVAESGTYSVEVVVDGCTSFAEVNYGFNTEIQTNFDNDQNLCEGETLTIDATPLNIEDYTNVFYQWSDENGTIEGATSAQFTIETTANYNVEIITFETVGEFTFECASTYEINVQGAEYQIDLGDNQTYCDEDEAQIITADLVGTIEEGAQITYLWNTGEETASIQVSENGTYSVEVSVDGCVETAEVTYTFNNSPQINLPTEVETCDLSTVVFDATPQNVDAALTTFEWRLDGNLLQDEFMELISADDYGFGTYELTAYSDDESCDFVQEIEVSPRFVSASLTTDSFDNLFCIGEDVVISADVTGIEEDDVTYTWFVNGVAQTGQNQAEFVHEIGSDTTNANQDVIALSVNVGGDCVADTVEVELDRYELDNCIIPEGMSPDGVNHTLDLRFLADRSGIRSLEIFNRFGKSVFKQNNYTDEFIGQNQNGTRLVTGTYFYVIKFNQEDPVYGREHKGWIYLNREQQ